jgi:hypothetical protein
LLTLRVTWAPTNDRPGLAGPVSKRRGGRSAASTPATSRPKRASRLAARRPVRSARAAVHRDETTPRIVAPDDGDGDARLAEDELVLGHGEICPALGRSAVRAGNIDFAALGESLDKLYALPDVATGDDDLQVMTIHKAKGLLLAPIKATGDEDDPAYEYLRRLDRDAEDTEASRPSLYM